MSAWRNPHEELETNVRCRDDTSTSHQSVLMDSSHLGINVSAREGCSKLAAKKSSMAPGVNKVLMVKKARREEPSTSPQYLLRDSSMAKVMDSMMMANLTNLKDQPIHPQHKKRDWIHMVSSVCPCNIAQSSKLDIHRRQALKQSCDGTGHATIKALSKEPSTHPQHVLSNPGTNKVLLKARGVNPTIANQRQAKHPLPVSLLAMTLLLYKVCGALGGRIVVDSHVTAVWGKNATLRCIFEDRENITQISWEKISTSALTVAVHHPVYGISIPGGYQGRAAFKSQSLHDATLVISNIGFSDAGHYICKAATFPLGNAQEKIKVDVIVEPTVSIRKGSTLIDEGNMTVAATCTAANGKPAAIVGWEGGLGQAELTNSSSHNNTVTVVSQYKMIPTRFAQGRTITCVVHHPAFEKEVRYPYILDIKYAPEVSVTGHDEKWYVGGENLQLRCNADANPPPSEFAWSRLDGEWPDGLLPLNNTLLFNGLLTYNHSGVYVCKVTNALGERSGQKSIRIFDPPTTPTAAPTVPRLQETTATIASTLSKKGFFPASTMEVRYGDNLGTVIGSTVGGALLVVLLIVVAGVLCYRRRQTFRGDYFTKNYIPPSGMQKESQLDVLQTGNMDPYPETLAKDQHPMNNLIMNERMGSLQKPNWNSVDTYNSRYQEQFARPQGYFEGIKPPVTTKPSHDGAYDDNDEDFVSHFDGSVISRKEWYV